MARDDFPKSVIDKLRMRVSNRCSRPGCRVPTTAPSGDEDKVNNIGIAAHICAAAPGGPRYSEEMAPTARKSITNAIWLCSNCSIEIDRDEERYPVSLLNQWKKEAESTASAELGKRLPAEEDAINTVSAALTGLPKKFLASAISNVHKASEQALELLDPRFTVKSAHSENGTHFGIFAKEDVRVSMNIQDNFAKEYNDKYKRLIEHGEDIEISSGAIKFNGSKLLEEMFDISENGKMVISAPKKKAIQKLWLINKKTSIVEPFEDIRGELSFGNTSFAFDGIACDGMFTFKYRKNFDNEKASITFGLDFQRWEGRDIRTLPYFSKFFSFFEMMVDGWQLFTTLEVEGVKALDSKGINASKISYVRETRAVLYYIDKISQIANSLEEFIPFTSDFTFNKEDFYFAEEVAKILKGQCNYKAEEITSNMSGNLIVDEGAKNIELLKNMVNPTNIFIKATDREYIRCFGKTLELPEKSVYLRNVTPSFSLPDRDLKQGEVVRVEWVPGDGFECRFEYAGH